MFVNVDMCKTVLMAGESTHSGTIFTELLNLFCEVLTIMCMSGDVSGAQLAGRRGRGSPLPFFAN